MGFTETKKHKVIIMPIKYFPSAQFAINTDLDISPQVTAIVLDDGSDESKPVAYLPIYDVVAKLLKANRVLAARFVVERIHLCHAIRRIPTGREGYYIKVEDIGRLESFVSEQKDRNKINVARPLSEVKGAEVVK